MKSFITSQPDVSCSPLLEYLLGKLYSNPCSLLFYIYEIMFYRFIYFLYKNISFLKKRTCKIRSIAKSIDVFNILILY